MNKKRILVTILCFTQSPLFACDTNKKEKQKSNQEPIRLIFYSDPQDAQWDQDSRSRYELDQERKRKIAEQNHFFQSLFKAYGKEY